MTNVLAIVVTYNRKVLLKECLELLLNQKEDLDILLVDNCSTDGTKEYIAEVLENEHVTYLKTHDNIGGAGGFYTGIKWGVEKKYSYLWIMDDDTMVEDNTLQALLEAKTALNDEFGFLCSDVRWIDGSPCAMNVPNINEKWYNNTDYTSNGLISVAQCSFVSCFFKAETVYDIGLPIKEFFIWGDDAEYTKRISNMKTSYLVTGSKVVHKMNSNIATDISQDSADRLFRYQFSYRNMYYVMKTQGNRLSKALYYYGIFLDFKKIMKSPRKGKWKKIKVIMKSVHAGKKFKPAIEFPNVN